MTIAEIYQQYQIMDNLRQHMYRVTAVALQLCDHAPTKIDKQEIKLACLLHDMGNILKFDLRYFPEFLQPQGLAYWEKVKIEFQQKYGHNTHKATLAITHEIGVSERVCELITAIGFHLAKKNAECDDYSAKICAYADMRVAPHGVVSLAERLADGRKRYGGRDDHDTFAEKMGDYVFKIEQQLFTNNEFRSEEITDQSTQPFLKSLPNTLIRESDSVAMFNHM